MLPATAVAVHPHAPARSSTLLIAGLANVTSQHKGLEVHTYSKMNTSTTAAQTMEEFSARSGSASGLPAPDGEPLATKVTTIASPRCTSRAARAPRHELGHKRATEQPKPKDYNKDYHVDLGTRSVSPYTFTVAVLEHAS